MSLSAEVLTLLRCPDLISRSDAFRGPDTFMPPPIGNKLPGSHYRPDVAREVLGQGLNAFLASRKSPVPSVLCNPAWCRLTAPASPKGPGPEQDAVHATRRSRFGPDTSATLPCADQLGHKPATPHDVSDPGSWRRASFGVALAVGETARLRADRIEPSLRFLPGGSCCRPLALCPTVRSR
jgi:hypothetical protein